MALPGIPTPPPRRSAQNNGESEKQSFESSILNDCTTATATSEFYTCVAATVNALSSLGFWDASGVSAYMTHHGIGVPSLAAADIPSTSAAVSSTSTQSEPDNPAPTLPIVSTTTDGDPNTGHSSRSDPTSQTPPPTRSEDLDTQSDSDLSSTTSFPSGTSLSMSSSPSNPTMSSSLVSSAQPTVVSSSIVLSNPKPNTVQPKIGASSPNHTGAIVGGVIGGLAFVILAACAFVFFRRRMRRSSTTPPSAEFMHMARGGGSSPAFDGKQMDDTMKSGDRLIPLARQSSIEEQDPPPPFTSGSYNDPVFEKVHAAAEMREQYAGQDSKLEEGGYLHF